MTHNKIEIIYYLIINCISDRSAPQILYLKDECIFRFSNFPIIGLCNPSANYWLKTVLPLISDLSCVAKVTDRGHLTALPEDFLSKTYKSFQEVRVDIHDIFGFNQYYMLYHVTVYHKLFF